MKQTKNTNTLNLINKAGKAMLLVIFFLTVISVSRGIYRLTGSESRVSEAKERLEQVKLEQEKLKRELAKIDSSFYQEKQARDKLGLAKEGEIVVVLPEESLLRRLSPRKAEAPETTENIPNWEKWAKLFFEI